MLPHLHSWDRAAPADTCVNLVVVWLKAIAGNRRGEGTADGGAAYAMLPHFTRRVVAWPLCYLYPRLHHANVALRTAYLDQQVERELSAAGQRPTRVVVLGAYPRPLLLSAPPLAPAPPSSTSSETRASRRFSSGASTFPG